MARKVRIGLAVGGLALLVLALLPKPTPSLSPGPVWEQTRTLAGAAPVREDERRGKSYAPLGVVLLDYVLDLGWDTDPSGATATREFRFSDEATARRAAAAAIAAGVRNGFAMQAGQLWRSGDGAWQDDGWSSDRKVRYVVTLLGTPSGTWTVHLLLEHTY